MSGAFPQPVRDLRFETAEELHDSAPEEPDWVWDGYIAQGAMTLLAGKPKWAGKSTLACALAEAVTAGAGSFLGRTVTRGEVVLLSEEGRTTLRAKVPRTPHIHVLTREAAWPKPSWPELIAAAVDHAAELGDASLLVIDSLSFWLSAGGGHAGDAGAWQAHMDHLDAALRAGLGVLLVHHQRKAGGEGGDAIRDSSAIAAKADMLVELERVDRSSRTQRRLVAAGRWGAPPVLVVDRDPATGGWRVVGEAEDRGESASVGLREQVLRSLPAGPPGATEPELADMLGLDKRKLPLRQLVADGSVERTGEGRKGAPYRYCTARVEAVPESCPEAGAERGTSGLSISVPPDRGTESKASGDAVPSPRAGTETGFYIPMTACGRCGRRRAFRDEDGALRCAQLRRDTSERGVSGHELGPIPRMALAREEAAAALGMSLDSFERHVQPTIRLVRLGRMRLVPVRELERWLDEHARRTV